MMLFLVVYRVSFGSFMNKQQLFWPPIKQQERHCQWYANDWWPIIQHSVRSSFRSTLAWHQHQAHETADFAAGLQRVWPAWSTHWIGSQPFDRVRRKARSAEWLTNADPRALRSNHLGVIFPVIPLYIWFLKVNKPSITTTYPITHRIHVCYIW